MCRSSIAFIRFEMSLDKNGCWLFCSLSSSKFREKIRKNQWSAAPHLRWSQRTRAALTWQMSLSLAPIIPRGQGMGRAERVSRSLSEHDFQVSSPSQLEDHWNSKFKTKNQIVLIDFQIGCLCWRQQSSDCDLAMHLVLAARHVETFLCEPQGSPNDFE